jgi:hypothetical protein
MSQEEFLTNSRKASYFIVDDYIVMHSHHCRVSQTSESATNPGNLLILGNDIYDDQEYEIVCPPDTILKELVVIRESDPRDLDGVVEIQLELDKN